LLVATTGYGQVEDRRRAAEAGFDHHLTKPVDVEVLVSLIRDGPPHRDDPFAPRVSRSLDIQDLG
jgi:CheY-like chemotaxis protein